jgi:hypothetical protein
VKQFFFFSRKEMDEAVLALSLISLFLSMHEAVGGSVLSNNLFKTAQLYLESCS